MLDSFNKYICSTCKSKICERGIVAVRYKDIRQIRCTDYEKDESKIKGYIRPKQRTANQLKSLMGFKQNY